jgi:cation:H+ antiporter
VKGRHDISVGNLVGSTIFNTLVVTGVASLVRPLLISPRFAGGTDFWLMIGVGLSFTAAVFVGRRTIRRVSGIALLLIYAGYIAYLLSSTVAS